MAGFIERSIDSFHPVERADISPLTLRPQVVHMLCPAEQLKELDCMRRPARHVTSELFEHRERALAATIVDGVGDIGANARGYRWPQVAPSKIRKKRLGGIW